MPKNSHPPRGGQKKPSASEASANGQSRDSSASRKGKVQESDVKQDVKAKGKAKDAAKDSIDPPEAPKKPDTRTLIGGASWTGKLPVNMWSEHCQKKKWDKPEYTMWREKEGFVAAVILRSTNPKTQEKTQLPVFEIPRQFRSTLAEPTAVEARHCAAALTLFRVCNKTNLHMMMPPKYKDLWRGTFQEIKVEDEANGLTWMYQADPFVALKEKQDAIAAAAKKKEEIAKQKAKEELQPGINATDNGGSRFKGWSKVPKVDMGKRTRRDVERLVRQHAIWNPHGARLSREDKDAVVEEVVQAGFKRAHVTEASEICKDREEMLEWLLIHVPEDDLPKWSLPENYSAGVSMGSGDLKREAAIKRLAAAGYSTDLCMEALETGNNDESRAAAWLQDQLLIGNTQSRHDHQSVGSLTLGDAWSDEQAVLESIFGDKYTSESESTISISLEPNTLDLRPVALHIRKPLAKYPDTLPMLSIHVGTPAYIRLAILKKALIYAQESLLGEPMIFNLVDWLENNMSTIVENPGRLSDVFTTSSTVVPTNAAHNSRFLRLSKPVHSKSSVLNSKKLLEEYLSRQSTLPQQRMLEKRRFLPAWQLRQDIVDAVSAHQVTIISGETGSGKSTQSVQFILDNLLVRELGDGTNIICTQPRRISALGLADRVAEERCGRVGDEVGYIIRGESKYKAGRTKICFVTTGVLLRRMQTSGGRTDDVVASLANVSHIVVDEVHERSLDTDFLLILLRDVLRKRSDLKVVLMSATLDADVFEKYFTAVGSVARIEIQGRTHPVTDYYLDDVIHMTGFQQRYEDTDDLVFKESVSKTIQGMGMKINYDLIAQTVRNIDARLGSKEGGILIFLPGTAEIDRTLQALRSLPGIYTLPLHASLLPAEQRRVFPAAPKGLRKVIAATNVAETSITIEDVVAVIDSGRVKELSFDAQNNMVKLEEVWASKAACKQRRGRAGRVQAGNCYKLFTRNMEERMADRPEPEIRRTPLEQLCLSVKAMGINDVPAFLANALTPPDSLAIEGAIALLKRMGAMDAEDLTALGRHLAMIPADLRCSKLLVYSTIFGCLEPCLTIASAITVRSPFVSPQGKRDEAKAIKATFGQGYGDILADLRAYEQYASFRQKLSHRDLRHWCEENFLSVNTLNDIASNRSQYLSSLKEIGLVPLTYTASASLASSLNSHAQNVSLITALIASAFYPQSARVQFPEKKYMPTSTGAVEQDPEARTIKYFAPSALLEDREERVFMHPGSTLFDAQSFPGNACFMSYFEKVATSKVFIRNVTPYNAYTALMFCGDITLDTAGRGLVLDESVKLRGWARIGALINRLRLLLDDVLARKIEAPSLDVSGDEVVAVVRRLVELDGLDR